MSAYGIDGMGVSAATADYRQRQRDNASDRGGDAIAKTLSMDLIIDGIIEHGAHANSFTVKLGKVGNNSKITFAPNDIPDNQGVLKTVGFAYSQKGFYWRTTSESDSVESLIALATLALGGPEPELPHVETARVQVKPIVSDVEIIACQRCGDSIAHDPSIGNELCASCEDNDQELATIANDGNPHQLHFNQQEGRMIAYWQYVLKLEIHKSANFENALHHWILEWNPALNSWLYPPIGNETPAPIVETPAHEPYILTGPNSAQLLTGAILTPAKKQSALPMPAKDRPVFGQVAKVAPKAVEPPSVLTLEVQDTRTESEKESERMKAAEAMTIPMFGDSDTKDSKAIALYHNDAAARLRAARINIYNIGDTGKMRTRGMQRPIAWVNREIERHMSAMRDALGLTDGKGAEQSASQPSQAEIAKPESTVAACDAPRPKAVTLDEWFGPKEQKQDGPQEDSRTVAELFADRKKNSFSLGTLLLDGKESPIASRRSLMLVRRAGLFSLRFYGKRGRQALPVASGFTVSAAIATALNRLGDGFTLAGYDRQGRKLPGKIVKSCPVCQREGSGRHNNLCDACFDRHSIKGQAMSRRELEEQRKLEREGGEDGMIAAKLARTRMMAAGR